MSKTIAQQLNVKDFPFEIEDKQGNRIYSEGASGYWFRCEYDSASNETYYEDYSGFWEKCEYDSSGNVIYYENCNGEIIDKRPKPDTTHGEDWDELAYGSVGKKVYHINSDAETKPDDVTLNGVNRTERGWAGHYICADRCKFRRNTLLSYKDINIVVSSVGLMVIDGEFEPIGADRHFETMAFHADKNDKRYFDADASKQVHFDSDWSISEVDADDKANEMHEAVVAEISTKLVQGYKFEERESSVI